MFTPEDKQKDFFDAYVYDRRVPRDHELIQIKEAVDWGFVEDMTRTLYCRNNGRPGYSPTVLFRMLFLEYYANLSDVEVSRECGYHLVYQEFAGIGMDDEIAEPTTLVEFRNRLGEKVFKGLFDELVKQLEHKGLLSEKVKAIDATHVEADVAVTSLMNLLRQGRRKVAKHITGHRKEWLKKFLERYPSEAVHERGRASTGQLQKEMELTKQFLHEVSRLSLDVTGQRALEELKKLSRGELGLVSFEDMDAQWGHKSKEKKFGGYKVHASMDESGIVTSAETLAGNVNEAGEHLSSLINDDRTKGVKAECVAVDGLYDRADTYEIGDVYGLAMYAPCRHGPQGLEKEYFFFDKEGCLRCRNYRIGGIDIRQVRKTRRSFYAFDCQWCLSKGSCLAQGAIQRQVWLNRCCEESMKQDKQARAEALEKRKRIEAKFGEAKKWHMLGRARYRGRWRVSIQALMTFFVINAKRMVKLLEKMCSPPGSLQVKTV